MKCFSTSKKCADTFIFQVQVLSVNKQYDILKILLTASRGHSLKVNTAPRLSEKLHPLSGPLCNACCEALVSLHEISPLLGFIYKWLWVQNSVCKYFAQKKPNPNKQKNNPWSFCPSCTCICTEWGIHLPAQTPRARDKWSSTPAGDSRNQFPSVQMLVALSSTIWVCL